MIEIIPATARHINTIAKRMRPIDILECDIMGHGPKEALRLGLLASTVAFTVLVDGKPEGMFGVVPTSLLMGEGRPWFLMTDVCGRQHMSLVKMGLAYTEAIQRQYPFLENWVHADNKRTIRWLTKLGYTVGEVDVIRGEPMRVFTRTKE